MNKVDYIVVGQGLAGSCLALEFLKRKIKFVVIDKFNPQSASQIAAGVFNPITGRTNQATWKASEIFPALHSFYLDAEKLLKSKFLFELSIYRPFLSEHESGKWPNETNAWIKEISQKSKYGETVNDPFGGIEINHGGFLKTQKFLKAVRNLLIGAECLQAEQFNFNQLEVGEPIKYKSLSADKIIFCDGVDALTNPFFHWLPIRKLKGELLTTKAALPKDTIINRGIFSVPSEENEWVIGSTYYHNDAPGLNPEKINDMHNRSTILFKVPIEISQTQWGHRPTTIDRRPILGSHPTQKNVCLFNGLGTKGVSLAPFFAVHLADWLNDKTELQREVNIARFYSLLLKS